MSLIIQQFALRDYHETWQAMRHYTDERTIDSPDQLWLLEHPSVYTLGQNGKMEHILTAGNVPVVNTDRGGQVTYHGPGQLVAYVLIDIKRKHWGVRHLVSTLENSIIKLLQEHYQIAAKARCDAPGVYVGDAKIASLGLRIRRGCSYHGLSFNIAMDTEPFSRINPCGFQNLPIIQLADLVPNVDITLVRQQLSEQLRYDLEYT